MIFTPPYPGEVTASAWTTERLNSPDFTINTKFLANGPDHGGGNLQIWYSREGEAAIKDQSLYTVEKFTGLVIAIDQHGGPGGGIRGFLNDGTTSFRNHPHLDTAAFGHCDYSYRNRGLPSKLQIKHDVNGLEVTIDDKPCFKTDKVTLPPNYYLGLTASSSANPDSFEVAKFITSVGNTPSTIPPSYQNREKTPKPLPLSDNTNTVSPPPSINQAANDITIEHVSDILASTLETSASQFADVHDRLQSLGHNTERLFSEYIRTSASLSGRIEELHSRLARSDQLSSMQKQITSLESAIRELKQVVEGGGGDMKGMLGELHESVRKRHDNLEKALPGHMGNAIAAHGPSMGLYLLYAVFLQAGILGGYVWWRRRREQSMKAGKYL